MGSLGQVWAAELGQIPHVLHFQREGCHFVHLDFPGTESEVDRETSFFKMETGGQGGQVLGVLPSYGDSTVCLRQSELGSTFGCTLALAL